MRIKLNIHFTFLWIAIFLFCSCLCVGNAQKRKKKKFYLKEGKKKAVIPFDLIHNLIVIKVQLNESDTLKFILDTGVSHTLVTDLSVFGHLDFDQAKKVYLFGLGGEDSISAVRSFNNKIRIGRRVFSDNVTAIIPLENVYKISTSMGTKIHGILGYDFFDSFIVKMNFSSEELTVYDAEKFSEKKLKRFSKIPITVESKKPYIKTTIALDKSSKKVEAKLLIDSGASHSLSLYSSGDDQIEVPDKSIPSILGYGLSGAIYGRLGRVSSLEINDFSLKNPVSFFPDSSSISLALDVANRKGSLGSEVLKRFHVCFDYSQWNLYLKPNSSYSKPFNYNLSGIEVVTPYPGLPIYEISDIHKNSPSEKAGLLKGDQILSINFKNAAKYKLNDIIELFNSKPGRKINIIIVREGEKLTKKFTLSKPI